MNQSKFKFLSPLLILVCVGAGLLITPASSNEPVDLPKLLVITTIGFGILAGLLISLKSVFAETSHIFLALVVLFLIQITIVVFTSGAPLNQQIYGTFGRNTGFLAYVSLLAITVGAALIAKRNFLVKFVISMIAVGVLSLFYDLLQTTGNDPVKWTNPYSPILGFLGNPDFEASFLGLVGILLVAIFLQNGIKTSIKVFTTLGLLSIAFIIYRSGAQQGFLVLALGSSVVILNYVFKSNNRIIFRGRFVVLSTIVIAGALAILGSLKVGPLGGILYKTSVRQRGFYWNAALHMMNQKPLNGVGLDSYGDWYFRARSMKAAVISPLVQSNAAHNVFLDLGSNGGWTLFLINIAIVVLVAFSGWKVIHRSKSFDWPFISIFGAWLGFEAQALISINQLGVGIWGWTLRGLVVGYEFKTRNLNLEDKVEGRISKRREKIQNNGNLVTATAVILGCIIGFGSVFPLYSGDVNYRSATASRSADRVFAAAIAKPQNTGRMIQAAELFANSKMLPQALELANKVISINPNAYNAWYLKSKAVAPDSPEGKKIASKLRELDPKGNH